MFSVFKDKGKYVCEFKLCPKGFPKFAMKDRLARHYAHVHKGESPRPGFTIDL